VASVRDVVAASLRQLSSGAGYVQEEPIASLHQGSHEAGAPFRQLCCARRGGRKRGAGPGIAAGSDQAGGVGRRAAAPRSQPGADVARCDKICDPPYQLGLGQQRRVTLIRHHGDVDLATPLEHGIERGRGQHI
jgi:hypothetical protein